ncbi:MAG: TlpA family protein disulfide reductase [Dehalococcoidia bacterium]|nr:MAG: TlpA family protein disulfide reductase [Dehalococcoidia bacterium]
MVRILKLLLVTALAAVLVVGLTTNACCDGVDGNGDVPNGDAPNGDEPNGNPNDGELDLISGFGIIIDCDDYSGQRFQDGDPAPDFRFEDAAGQTFSLSDFRGKSVMLKFWATWCGYCILELPYVQQVYDDWQGGEVVILTIDIGERADKVNDLLNELGFSLPVLLDIEAEVAAQYRVSSMPRTFFIDKEGLIRYIKFGAFQSAKEIEDILNQLIAL